MLGRENLTWKGNALHHKGRPLVTIEQDQKYPTMWRVKLPSSALSDMANKTRARDAAVAAALAILNSRERPLGAPPMRHSEGAATG